MSVVKKRYESEIIEHLEMAPYTRKLVLDAPELAQSAQPGQFVHVLCGNLGDPLLRRPFSIHDADPEAGRISLLYEIRGRGTALLAERSAGETLDLLGPLGTGFALPKPPGRPVLLVGGGVGVAPLCFLAHRIADAVGCERVSVLIGARTKEMLLCVDRLSRLGCDVRAATDDGTAGHHGFVTELLSQCIETSSLPLVYACGPMPMLAVVAGIVKAHGLKCQISTEAKMACGVGACMSCAIKVRSGESFKYVRACDEGPVFDADEVVW